MAHIHYLAMVACHEKLVTGIKQGADSLADALFQVGVLPESLRDDVYSEKEEVRKARQLVSFLEDKIRDFPSRHNDLMNILREKSDLYPQFGTLAIQLENKKAELLQEAQVLSGSNQTLISELTYISSRSEQDNALYIRFECSCGECSIQEFLDGKNCPNSPPKPPPQLSLWSTESSRRVPTQADIKYSEYKVVMTENNQDLRSEYQSLLSNTMNEIKAKHSLQTVKDQLKVLITPHGASKSLFTRMYTREVKGHIRDLQTYDELQKYLENNFCCWFNISLIVNLRKVLLQSDSSTNIHEDSRVIAYKEHISQFFKRCCFKRTRYDEHQLQPHTEIVCSVFTDFKEVHQKQVREFEHQLRQTIALPECERRVENDGDLVFKFKDNQVSQRRDETAEDVTPLVVSLETNSLTGYTQGEPSIDYQRRKVYRDLESDQHGQRNVTRRIKNLITRIFKVLRMILLWLLVGSLFLGVEVALFHFRRYLSSYPTISLGSTRVFANTSTVLRNEFRVSNLTNYDSFTFSTQSGLTCIYITDCRPFNESISRQDSIESGRTAIFSQHIATGSSIMIQVETESGLYVNCSTELIVFDRGRYEYMFVKTGKKKWPFKEFCISKTFQFHFEPQKMSYFSFVIATSEPVRFSVAGNVLRYNILARCLISNTNNCIINKKRHFANHRKVCVTATPKDSDVSYSDVHYGIKKKNTPWWGVISYLLLIIPTYSFEYIVLIMAFKICINLL